jgi:hypothetical protein
VDTTGGAWLDDFKITWTVNDLGSGVWEYIYELTQADGDPLDPGAVSHGIIEISPNATKDDFWNFKADGVAFSEVAIDDFGPGTHGNSNPNIPGTIHGLKLDQGDGTIYSFLSSKAPMWGDFYAKDGSAAKKEEDDHGDDHGSEEDKPKNAAWNADFLEEDPTAGPQDGLLSDGHGGYIYKILRPDTTNGGGHHDPEVPEPATLALVTLGLAAATYPKRKKSSQ